MRPRRGLRAALARWLWSLGTWRAARRRLGVRSQDVQRQLYRTQTRGMGLRFTERLRDRLRPRWLRLRRQDVEPPDS